jgi:hypothetical protein
VKIDKTRVLTHSIDLCCIDSEAENVEKRKKEKEEHSVEAYESKFKEIQEITGENDLDKLVEKFIIGMMMGNFFFNILSLKKFAFLSQFRRKSQLCTVQFCQRIEQQRGKLGRRNSTSKYKYIVLAKVTNGLGQSNLL